MFFSPLKWSVQMFVLSAGEVCSNVLTSEVVCSNVCS